MFSLICAWINGWVNTRGACDLRRHRTHYDVTAMMRQWLSNIFRVFNFINVTEKLRNDSCTFKTINAYISRDTLSATVIWRLGIFYSSQEVISKLKFTLGMSHWYILMFIIQCDGGLIRNVTRYASPITVAYFMKCPMWWELYWIENL